jgi:large subunit ribosomal protein L22
MSRPTEPFARARYVRRSPRKVRLVAGLVRGLRVSDALAQLQFSPKHAARDLAKVIRSAAANAEHNWDLSRDQLWVKQVVVDPGPIMKRIRPVSRGMAHRYFHRTCHITVVVEERPEPVDGRQGRRRPPARAVEAPAVEREAPTLPEASGEVGEGE